jgi:outer membrane protein assembly factor BamB
MEQNEKQSGLTRFLYLTASGLAGVTGLFTLIMCVLIIATFVQLRRIDPLNSPALVELRERFSFESGNEELKQEIRAFDLFARKAFFTGQSQIKTGAWLILIGFIVFLLALKTAADLNKQPPHPDSCQGTDNIWDARRAGRKFVAFGGIVLILLCLVLGFLPRPNLETQPAGTPPEAQPTKPEIAVASKEDIEKNWPYFRGPYGNGTVQDRDPPVSWDGESGQGILWKTPVPGKGYSSPVVWANRLFLTSGDATNREVYCFDTETGSLLWQAEEKNIPGAGKLPEVNKNTGWAAPSPAIDGERVFAIFATGNIMCLDMTGKIIWTKALGTPDNHYAYSSSPIIYKHLLIVQFDNRNDPRMLALNAATGDIVWQTKRKIISWSSPICVETTHGMQLVLTDNISVTGYDPETGRELWDEQCLGGEMGPSAAYADGMFFVCNDGARAAGITLTRTEDNKLNSEMKWEWFDALPDTASPLATDKYVFLATSSGLISCVDAKEGQTVWEQDIDRGCYASPIRVGDRVYLVDRTGITHIFKIGPAWESLGEPALGEGCSATPAFVGNRIYIRTDENLYCIGEK